MSVGSLERACGSHCQRYSIPVVRSLDRKAVAAWARAKTDGSEWLNTKKSFILKYKQNLSGLTAGG